jgi:hypothetical protein
LRTTLDQATHDNLRRLQELLSHSVPSGDIAEVLGRAFELAIKALEKRRFAATSRPSARRRSQSVRHIPAHVRREVGDRDRYQCTFVSASGKRCSEKRFLEYDHVQPVARGGEATVANTRFAAGRTTSTKPSARMALGFMREKRQAAQARKKPRACCAASRLNGHGCVPGPWTRRGWDHDEAWTPASPALPAAGSTLRSETSSKSP